MATQDFISKDATGKYILIEVQEGQQFPTNAIALPAGTNAVTRSISTGEAICWRNSIESYFGSSITNGSWLVNPNYQDAPDIEILWEREGFVYPVPSDENGTIPNPVDPIPDLGSALEFADSEFIYLLEGLTHKRLSEIQKRVVKNILNNQ